MYGPPDPTVLQLEAEAAEMMGKEAALFTTSGTQGNLIAIMVHCKRGDEVIMGDLSHTFYYEGRWHASNTEMDTRLTMIPTTTPTYRLGCCNNKLADALWWRVSCPIQFLPSLMAPFGLRCAGSLLWPWKVCRKKPMLSSTGHRGRIPSRI